MWNDNAPHHDVQNVDIMLSLQARPPLIYRPDNVEYKSSSIGTVCSVQVKTIAHGTQNANIEYRRHADRQTVRLCFVCTQK